jgi:hypothetical protein
VAIGTTSGPRNVTLTNKGAVTFSVTGISLTSAYASRFAQTVNCPASLAPGASCAISMTFTPAAAASKSAKLSIAPASRGEREAGATGGRPVTRQADPG